MAKRNTAAHWIYAQLDDSKGWGHAACPTCEAKFRVLAKHHEKVVKCPKCGCPFEVIIELNDEPTSEEATPSRPVSRLVYLLAFLIVFAFGYWAGRQHYHFELQYSADVQTLEKVFEE